MLSLYSGSYAQSNYLLLHHILALGTQELHRKCRISYPDCTTCPNRIVCEDVYRLQRYLEAKTGLL